MQERSIVERVVIQEGNVEALDRARDRLADVESQLMQLREEIRGDLSAVRVDIRRLDEEMRRAVRVLHDNLVARLSAVGDAARLRKRR